MRWLVTKLAMARLSRVCWSVTSADLILNLLNNKDRAELSAWSCYLKKNVANALVKVYYRIKNIFLCSIINLGGE